MSEATAAALVLALLFAALSRPDGHRAVQLHLGGGFAFALCFGLHFGKASVVVRELVEVGPRDLGRHEGVIAGDVRLWIARAMLEL